MRNANRKPGPIRRTIVAPHVDQPVSRNLAIRVQTVAAPSMPVRRSRAASLSGAQQNSNGSGLSPWAMTPNLRPFSTAMTRAWSDTVSDVRI